MKKKIRKNQQLSMINLKGAGRPAINDRGIRHTKRPVLSKPSSLHLTVKVQREKAGLKTKGVLALLRRSILNARKQGLRVIHFSLEYDHVHLLIEADSNRTLGKGMQAFGVTLSKAINRARKLKGTVYKHRYHFRKITSSRELKNVLNYIFTNGVKHKTANSMVNPFNSIQAEIKHQLFCGKNLKLNLELMSLLDRGKVHFRGMDFVL